MTPDQAHTLLQYGYNKLQEEGQSPKSEPDPEPATAEDKIAALEAKLAKFEEQGQSEKHYNQLNQTISMLVSNNEDTKNDKDFRDAVVVEAMARYNLDTRQDLSKLFKEAVDRQTRVINKRVEEAIKKIKNSDKLDQFINTPPHITGKSATLEAKKKLTGSDLANGTARKVFLELIGRD